MLDLKDLKLQGEVGGVAALAWCQSVLDGKLTESSPFQCETSEIAFLIPLAAMLLALPGSEAIDESSFSVAGRTLTRDRNQLDPITVEMLVVFRRYVSTCGISLADVKIWVENLLTQLESERLRGRVAQMV